jgi:hypothetical protein
MAFTHTVQETKSLRRRKYKGRYKEGERGGERERERERLPPKMKKLFVERYKKTG